MALIPLRALLDHAAENNYGVGAFNVNNLEQIQSIMEAARKTQSPVIIQASRGARKYAQDAFLRHLMIAATEIYPEVPTVMHQDHGNSPDTCFSAIRNGFTSVMMDGSLKADGATPADYDYNVRVTQQTVAFAHACGVSVEGELGCLGSLETGEAGEEVTTGGLGHGIRLGWGGKSSKGTTGWPGSPSGGGGASGCSAVVQPGGAARVAHAWGHALS